MKVILKKLDTYAHNGGRDFANVFDSWLDWMIDHWSLDTVLACKCNLSAVNERMRQDNPTFHDCYTLAVTHTAEEIEKQGWSDAFGSLYEEKIKSGYKASSMGQFFTSDSLCELIASVGKQGEYTPLIYDPACGSGRLPLAVWGLVDKKKFHYFVLGDLDPLSCKMSALNMMFNGMFGIVERRDALTKKFFNGYIINEMCYPFPSGIPSIRKADEAECQDNLRTAWRYIPKKIDNAPHSMPQQFSLFNF